MEEHNKNLPDRRTEDVHNNMYLDEEYIQNLRKNYSHMNVEQTRAHVLSQ